MHSASVSEPTTGGRNHVTYVAVFAIGFALTVSLAWATKQADDATEQRLLEQQTKQAAAVLASAVMVNQQPLLNALTVQPAIGPVDAALFLKSMSGSVGAGKTFVSASMWQRAGDRMVRISAIGAAPAMTEDAPSTQAFVSAALGKATFTTAAVRSGDERRVAYALADARAGRVVYAERTIPADGRSPSDSDDAFADINYAIYLGPAANSGALTTTNVDPRSLPFTERTDTERVAFGDSALTLVTAPRHYLSAPLSHHLPTILLAGGLFMTMAALAVSLLLARRRQSAEESAAFAVTLSERLQRALLPLAIPKIDQLEFAVDYVAGTRGVDIGGDWYSIIGLDPDHFAFVIGDVSGKGIDAVAVMARARFTLRAYLLRGDSPAASLTMAARQFDVIEDGHIVTTIVGVGNSRTGKITVANAGHCKPALLHGAEAGFINSATGPPLGADQVTYADTTFSMASGDTLFCYTDGLIERRGEDIDTGMNRLSGTLASAPNSTVADMVDRSVRSRGAHAEDDVAVLAFRWTAPTDG